jgi:thiamine biosynthesis protein ThiS
MPRITITYQGKEKSVEIPENTRVSELLKKLRINPETVLVRRSNEIIPDTETLRDKDKIHVLKVISGG